MNPQDMIYLYGIGGIFCLIAGGVIGHYSFQPIMIENQKKGVAMLLLGMALAVLGTVQVAALSNMALHSTRSVGVATTAMPNGKYEVLWMQKMFNGYTGEPEYWIVAEHLVDDTLGGVPIVAHTRDYRFYVVPRKQFSYPAPDNKPATNSMMATLIMENGTGRIDAQ